MNGWLLLKLLKANDNNMTNKIAEGVLIINGFLLLEKVVLVFVTDDGLD